MSPGPPQTDRPIATVGALLFDADDRILLVRAPKWSGLYAIPGGKIEHGETQETALHREVLEETGLRLGDVRFVCVQDCIESPEFHAPRHFLLINFVARVVSGTLRLNEEATEARWVTLEESLALPLNTPTRILVREVLARDLRPACSSPAARAQA